MAQLKDEPWDQGDDDPYGIGFSVETVKTEPETTDKTPVKQEAEVDEDDVKKEEAVDGEDPGDGGGKLPPYWGYARTLTGRIYFLNHWTKTTTWSDPRGTWNAPILAKPCLSFMKSGFCPMGDGCLFRHITKKEFDESGETIVDPDAEPDNFEIIENDPTEMDLAPPTYGDEDEEYEEVINKVFEEHDGCEWRFSDGIHDFHINDPVYVVAEQESLESYPSNQLLRLGEMGTVQQIVPGGHCIRVRHKSGEVFNWMREDLLVLRAATSAPVVEKKKKAHRWVKAAQQRNMLSRKGKGKGKHARFGGGDRGDYRRDDRDMDTYRRGDFRSKDDLWQVKDEHYDNRALPTSSFNPYESLKPHDLWITVKDTQAYRGRGRGWSRGRY
eukprot:TRINITY_DN21672_c0_g1_i1.p1 TRINITY_DN21672_c0_g1~~TRINITY_DN21672_c0_g1_i1.p1  ORF type:complete len:384 (+),score=60.45 TRINITY_DN21672_c0_g1_i1:50-1201(+)